MKQYLTYSQEVAKGMARRKGNSSIRVDDYFTRYAISSKRRNS